MKFAKFGRTGLCIAVSTLSLAAFGQEAGGGEPVPWALWCDLDQRGWDSVQRDVARTGKDRGSAGRGADGKSSLGRPYQRESLDADRLRGTGFQQAGQSSPTAAVDGFGRRPTARTESTGHACLCSGATPSRRHRQSFPLRSLPRWGAQSIRHEFRSQSSRLPRT